MMNTACAQNSDENCFRRTTAKGFDELLPSGVCLTNDRYAIDDVIVDIDFNQDGTNDLAIRYFNFPYTTGDTVFYEFFIWKGNSYSPVGIYPNIYPPILNHTVYGAIDSPDSTVRQLVQTYPYDLEISFEGGNLLISHLIPEDFGKNYVFVFDSDLLTWKLDRTEFYAGNLDGRDVERMDLSRELIGKVILETKKPNHTFLLEDFDLIESNRQSEQEEREYFDRKYDIFEIGRR